MKDCIYLVSANYENKVLTPLLTRFLTLKIPEYTKQEFYDIGVKLLQTPKYGKNAEIASYIVDQVWKIFTETRKENQIYDNVFKWLA